MGAFIPDARTQQHVPICNAIEAGDFRQALKLVDKRLAKSSDTYLLALRCYVQSKHDLSTERCRAYIRLATLGQPSCKEIISDADELSIYEEAAAALSSCQDDGKVIAFICQVRLAAVKSNPKDEMLCKDCFHACVNRSNWDYAQQIATILEKNFPGNHEYPFWKLTAILTFIKTAQCDLPKKNILISVASRIMQTFANATIAASGASVLPVRSLHTPQELLLFHKILEANGQISERLEAYKNPHIGVSSKIAKGEWVFKRDHVLLLEADEKWEELFDTCNNLLEGAQATTTGIMADARGADWRVWQAYINAAIALQTKESHDKVRDQIKSHLASTSGLNKTYKRNVSLANLLFSFKLEKEGKSRTLVLPSGARHTNITPQQAALMAYLSQYGHTASAFADVKTYVEMLSLKDIMELYGRGVPLLGVRAPWAWIEDIGDGEKPTIVQREKVSDVGRITAHVTLQKLEIFYKNCNPPADARTPKSCEYDSVDSDDEYISCPWCRQSRYVWCEKCQMNTVIRLVRDYSTAISGFDIGGPWVNGHPIGLPRHLKLLPPDKHPLDDMAIMAATALIKLTATPANRFFAKPIDFRERHGHQRLIQAAAFLEFAHTKSAANTEILLLLVKLYSFLGAGSLALRAYSKLNIKQIQGDTLGYVMFDRISSLHPHPVQDEVSGSIEILDPAANIAKIQRMYRNVRTQINNSCRRSFESGSYDSVCQLMEASERLSRSIGTAISVIELRKIVRLTEPNIVLKRQSQGYDLLPTNPTSHQLSDNLDYKCFPDFETSDSPSVERWLRLGPPPSDFRARGFLLVDELWTLFRNPNDGQSKMIANLKHLENSFSTVEKLTVAEHMTGYEICLYAVGASLVQFILASCYQDQERDVTRMIGPRQCIVTIGMYLSNLKHIGRLDVNAMNYHPNFEKTLHPLYVAHETASLVIAASNFLNSKSVNTNIRSRKEIDFLALSARELQQVVVDKAEEVRVKMNGGGWIDRVMTWLWEEPVGNPNVGIMQWWHPNFVHTPGRWIAQELGQEFCEWWVGELVDSWKESVIGLAALQVNAAKK